jgi:hypothetical protein
MEKKIAGAFVAGLAANQVLESLYAKFKKQKDEKSSDKISTEQNIENLAINIEYFAKGYVVGGAAFSAIMMMLINKIDMENEEKATNELEKLIDNFTNNFDEYYDFFREQTDALSKVLEESFSQTWPYSECPLNFDFSEYFDRIYGDIKKDI